jgi:hypothetical protein
VLRRIDPNSGIAMGFNIASTGSDGGSGGANPQASPDRSLRRKFSNEL